MRAFVFVLLVAAAAADSLPRGGSRYRAPSAPRPQPRPQPGYGGPVAPQGYGVPQNGGPRGRPNIEIVEQENQQEVDGAYQQFYTQTDGQSVQESGEPASDGWGVEKQGAYTYTGDDGQEYSVTYTAGKDGVIAQGDHLPQEVPQIQAYEDLRRTNPEIFWFEDGLFAPIPEFQGDGGDGGQQGYGAPQGGDQGYQGEQQQQYAAPAPRPKAPRRRPSRPSQSYDF